MRIVFPDKMIKMKKIITVTSQILPGYHEYIVMTVNDGHYICPSQHSRFPKRFSRRKSCYRDMINTRSYYFIVLKINYENHTRCVAVHNYNILPPL